jgi:hypothetical protein
MPLHLKFVPNVPIPDMLGLDEEQRACVMLVLQGWSLLESFLQKLLTTLAQSPLLLGQALTEDLGPDHRIKALRRLANSWLWRLNPQVMGDAIGHLHEVQELAKWIASNKDSRNQLVHWQWSALDNERLLCFKYTLRLPPGAADADPEAYAETTLSNVLEFAEEIDAINDRLQAVTAALEQLPAWT